MRLKALLDGQTRDRYISMAKKVLLELVRSPRDSIPIFVLGRQRSGTSMLMYAFHRHPQVMVYDEHRQSRAFDNFRLRPFPVINEIVRQSSFPGVCFKPICDSHLIVDLATNVPGAQLIWIYRDYRDVANSALRKFSTPTRAIRLVCEGKAGGGWLQDGVTPPMQRVLSSLYSEGLSDFDLSCLVWWARNRSVLDSGLIGSRNLTVVKYEALVTRPNEMMQWLFDRIGISFHPAVARRLTARSIGRNPAPAMNNHVLTYCEDVMRDLDYAFSQECSIIVS